MWGLIMDHGQEGRAGWGLVAKGQWGCHFKCIFVIPETKGKNTLQVNKYIWFNSCSFVFLYAWKKTSTLVSLFLASFSTPHYSQSLSLLWLFHSLLFCYVMSLLVKKKKKTLVEGRKTWSGSSETLPLYTPCSLTQPPFIWAPFAAERKHRVILRYLTLIHLYQWLHLWRGLKRSGTQIEPPGFQVLTSTLSSQGLLLESEEGQRVEEILPIFCLL